MTIEITTGTEAQIAAAEAIRAKLAAAAETGREHHLGASPDHAAAHWSRNLAAFPAEMRGRGEELIARWDEIFAHASVWLDRGLERDIPTYVQTGKVAGALARIGFTPRVKA